MDDSSLPLVSPLFFTSGDNSSSPKVPPATPSIASKSFLDAEPTRMKPFTATVLANYKNPSTNKTPTSKTLSTDPTTPAPSAKPLVAPSPASALKQTLSLPLFLPNATSTPPPTTIITHPTSLPAEITRLRNNQNLLWSQIALLLSTPTSPLTPEAAYSLYALHTHTLSTAAAEAVVQAAIMKKKQKKEAKARGKKVQDGGGEEGSSFLGNEADGEGSEGEEEEGGVKLWSAEQDLLLVRAVESVWDGFWGEVARRVERGQGGGVWGAGECERRFEEL